MNLFDVVAETVEDVEYRAIIMSRAACWEILVSDGVPSKVAAELHFIMDSEGRPVRVYDTNADAAWHAWRAIQFKISVHLILGNETKYNRRRK